jgi:uncharacterized membrane protein
MPIISDCSFLVVIIIMIMIMLVPFLFFYFFNILFTHIITTFIINHRLLLLYFSLIGDSDYYLNYILYHTD